MKTRLNKKVTKGDEKDELIKQLSARLEALENKAKENRPADEPKVGFQKYGASAWKSWVNGSEKGYHRSFYVDISNVWVPNK